MCGELVRISRLAVYDVGVVSTRMLVGDERKGVGVIMERLSGMPLFMGVHWPLLAAIAVGRYRCDM